MPVRDFWYADSTRLGDPAAQMHERWSEIRMSEEQMRMASAQRY